MPANISYTQKMIMKNKILFVLLFSVVSVCHAQFETGKKIIGGQMQLGFSNYNYNPGSTTATEQHFSQFSTSLSLSRFKSPTLLNGFGISYVYNYNNAIGNILDNSHTIGIFVNSTKLQPLANKFYLSFTGTAGAGYGFGKTNFVNSTNYTKSKGYNVYVSGGMGLLYQLNQRFLLSCGLTNLLNMSYNHGDITIYSGTNVNESKNNSVNLSSGLSGFSLNNLAVGVRYMLK